MIVKPYKTHKITPNENLFEILDRYLPKIEEGSIVAIASKIVGICEGRVSKKESQEQKDEFIKQEAEYYLPEKHMELLLTINHNTLVVNAGIDESNSNGLLSLWPNDPQQSANVIREYLSKKYNIQRIGVILTDSKITPLRWGVTGYMLTHSGFLALKNYIGKQDIFGQTMHVEQASIADSLATAAVAVTGEGDEQQPLAVITDVPFVEFQQRNPTHEELEALKITLEDDVYAPLLKAVIWQKGKQK
ncbi:MAG: coenzyme F420-0:L-glutamate ligase [Patescibacteria group bacterium]